MKKSFLFLALAALMLSACGSSGTSKSDGNTGDSSSSLAHTHTFSDVWSKDDTYHWHTATCEHTSEVKDKSEHTFNAWVIDTQATETTEGARHKVCKICNHRVDEVIQVIDHVHNWNEPTYTWSLDNSTCTAKRTCSINLYHVEEETVESSYSVITAPTTDTYGVGRYSVSFTNTAFESQYKDVKLQKLDVPVVGVSLNKTTLELSVSSYAALVESVSPYNATNRNVKWSTSNNLIATVSEYGLVTGISEGKATITVKTDDGGFEAKCEVTVTYVPVTGVTLTSNTVTLEVGEQTTSAIYANVLPNTASVDSVKWTIDDDKVALMGWNLIGGLLLKGLKVGTATVTVTTDDGGFTTTCIVNVVEQKNFSYEIGDAVVDVYSYSSGNRAKVYVPVTNNGNVNIYIGSCSVDILDSGDNLKQTVNYMSCHPSIVRPGETAYVFDDVSYTGDTLLGLVGDPHLTIKDASLADDIRYDVSNVSFVSDSLFGFKANGTITNNNEAASTGSIYIAIILFDNTNEYLATLYKYFSDDLAVGGSADFVASNLDTSYYKNDMHLSDIDHYDTYAYEPDYVY